MGQVWADAVSRSPDWEATAYVDLSQPHMLAAASQHGLPKNRCFHDVKRAFKSVEAEAVLDVTPPAVRKKVCLEAFAAGLHVLSEKPLADSVKNARAIVTEAKRTRRVYMVAQNYRFQPVVQTAKRFIEQGRLGDVGYAGINFHKGPHFGGFREKMPYPLLLDMSIHHFDMLRCMLGADVKAVTAASVSAPWNWNKGQATAMVQLEMSGGVVANYFGSWVSSGWETTWNADWRFEGSKGVLLIEKDQLFFANKPETRRKVPLAKRGLTHQDRLLHDFAIALEQGGTPETNGKDNLNSFATTHAVVRAAKTKQRIPIRDILREAK